MIARDEQLLAVVLDGKVAVRSGASLPLAALYLGAGSLPSWDALRRVGPIRFDVGDPSEAETFACRSPFERDFGNSLIRCTSNAPAIVRIANEPSPSNPRHLPAALGFAFSQQWARLGHACVHGALLVVEGQGVLVLGQRGAGKSVLATSALVAGGGIVSDDYLLVGESNGGPLGERIRAFLSLRQSWAARTLFPASEQEWRPNRHGTRVFLTMQSDTERFPEHHPIDHVWVLVRPRAGRRLESHLEPISQSEIFASLVAATQPLLLGCEFPHERDRLMHLFSNLASRGLAARLETGQDIVLEPRAAWQRLLTQS